MSLTLWIKAVPSGSVLAIILTLLSGSGAVAQSTGQRLLEHFADPYVALDCGEFPLLERLKYERCRFGYLRDLRQYAEERDAVRLERLEIEKSRAWLWFNAPPAVGNCNTLPEVEKAKFDYQCAPRAASDGAVGLFEVKLSQLQSQRDALAARVAIVRSDYERLSAKASRQLAVAPPEVQALGEVLAKLDQAERRTALLRRFSIEAQRLQGVDLSAMERILIATAPAALALRRAPGAEAPLAGQTREGGDVVVVVGEAADDAASLILVHTDLGVVYASKSEFYAR